jgi:hypothetical protein
MIVHVQINGGEPRGRILDVEVRVPAELAVIIGEAALEEAASFAAETLLTAMHKHRRAIGEATGLRGRLRDDPTLGRVLVVEEGTG